MGVLNLGETVTKDLQKGGILGPKGMENSQDLKLIQGIILKIPWIKKRNRQDKDLKGMVRL